MDSAGAEEAVACASCAVLLPFSLRTGTLSLGPSMTFSRTKRLWAVEVGFAPTFNQCRIRSFFSSAFFVNGSYDPISSTGGPANLERRSATTNL